MMCLCHPSSSIFASCSCSFKLCEIRKADQLTGWSPVNEGKPECVYLRLSLSARKAVSIHTRIYTPHQHHLQPMASPYVSPVKELCQKKKSRQCGFRANLSFRSASLLDISPGRRQRCILREYHPKQPNDHRI